MSVLGYAIWLRMDPKITNYVLAVYDNHINDYYIICYTLMATGGVMTFVGFLGCCGAFQESKCMLGTVSVAVRCFLCKAFIPSSAVELVFFNFNY